MHLNLEFEQIEIYLRQGAHCETQDIFEKMKAPFNQGIQGEKFDPQTYQDLILSTIFEMSEVQNKEYHLWVTLY